MYVQKGDFITKFDSSTLGLTEDEQKIYDDIKNGIYNNSKDNFDLVNSIIQKILSSVSDIEKELFMTATSLEDLDGLANKIIADNGSFSLDGYVSGLEALASQYSNTSDEIKAVREAMSYTENETDDPTKEPTWVI
jgi:hypothetical protein